MKRGFRPAESEKLIIAKNPAKAHLPVQRHYLRPRRGPENKTNKLSVENQSLSYILYIKSDDRVTFRSVAAAAICYASKHIRVSPLEAIYTEVVSDLD